MAGLHTTGLGDTFEIPKSQLGRIVDRVQNQSVLATLSPERPTLYGDVQAVRMTRKPRAEIVGEGEQKSSELAEWANVIAQPIKFQTTVRITNEVEWVDEDHRLGIVDDLVNAIGESMARAVDLIGIHGINPKTGARATQVPVGRALIDTSKAVTAGSGDTSDPDGELTEAYGLVGAEGTFLANGLGIDPRYAFAVGTQRKRDANGQPGDRVNPDFGFGSGGSWNGLTVARSTAIAAAPEAPEDSDNRKLRALMGDFDQFRWGFQRRIPVETIRYGDPDGGGDLKRTNELAFRAEGVIYTAVFDLGAFAKVSVA